MAQSGFNPKTRWDRHTLSDNRKTQSEEFLDEKITVLAWFNHTKIQPRMFIWNNKPYKIKKTTYTWQSRNGQELIVYFSVSTGADVYQISFNNSSFSWRLDKILA